MMGPCVIAALVWSLYVIGHGGHAPSHGVECWWHQDDPYNVKCELEPTLHADDPNRQWIVIDGQGPIPSGFNLLNAPETDMDRIGNLVKARQYYEECTKDFTGFPHLLDSLTNHRP